MLGSWQSWSEVMTLNTALMQHCMWRVVVVWEKDEVLESWSLINYVKNQAFHIISFCACNKIVTLYACLYGIWKDFVLPCFLLVVLWTLSNEAKMRMIQPHPRISRVSPLNIVYYNSFDAYKTNWAKPLEKWGVNAKTFVFLHYTTISMAELANASAMTITGRNLV